MDAGHRPAAGAGSDCSAVGDEGQIEPSGDLGKNFVAATRAERHHRSRRNRSDQLHERFADGLGAEVGQHGVFDHVHNARTAGCAALGKIASTGARKHGLDPDAHVCGQRPSCSERLVVGIGP